jgi:hypothetical protein
MKKMRNQLGLLVVIAALCSPLSLLASGSYCACMPKPPPKGQAGKVDRDKFDLGQKVFSNRMALAQGDAAAQRPRLQALQAQLPEKVAKKKDLTALAGKLSDQQLEALEYYVAQRYAKTK